jgi:hypothetical protein
MNIFSKTNCALQRMLFCVACVWLARAESAIAQSQTPFQGQITYRVIVAPDPNAKETKGKRAAMTASTGSMATQQTASQFAKLLPTEVRLTANDSILHTQTIGGQMPQQVWLRGPSRDMILHQETDSLLYRRESRADTSQKVRVRKLNQKRQIAGYSCEAYTIEFETTGEKRMISQTVWVSKRLPIPSWLASTAYPYRSLPGMPLEITSAVLPGLEFEMSWTAKVVQLSGNATNIPTLPRKRVVEFDPKRPIQTPD